jgi:hypothetical protein
VKESAAIRLVSSIQNHRMARSPASVVFGAT